MSHPIKGILDQLDSYKSRYSRFTNRLRPERNGYCSFLQGILFTRLQNIYQVQQFVEALLEFSDRQRITAEIQKLILVTAYDYPSIIPQTHRVIFDKMDVNPDLNVKAQLQKLKETFGQLDLAAPAADSAPVANQLEKSDATVQIASQDTVVVDIQNIIQSEEEARRKLELESQKLARAMQAEEEALANSAAEQNCQICLMNLLDEDWMPLDTCTDVFHKECMKEAFRSNISERKFPLKCPNDECGKHMLQSDLRQILGPDLYPKYSQLTFKSYVDTHGDSVSWCPTADCSHCFFYTEDDGTRFECPLCKKEYCLKCRVEWHKNMSCKQWEVNNTFNEDDKKFLAFVKGAKFKQCPKCKYWVEKNMGCDHMSCRCGYQFCYKCGGKYGECECVKEAQQRMREQLARAQERRDKKLASAKARKEAASKRSRSKPAPVEPPEPQHSRNTRARTRTKRSAQ